MKTFLKKRNSIGFSLIEILIVIGVIAVIAVAAFLIYPIARDRLQAKQEIQNIRAIQSNVRATFLAKNGSYTGLGNGKGAGGGPDKGVANLARAFPTSMNNGDFSRNATIHSSWGADVWVWARPDIVTPLGPLSMHKSFGILYENIPVRVCPTLASALANDFHSININGTEIMTSKGANPLLIPAACNRLNESESYILFTSI